MYNKIALFLVTAFVAVQCGAMTTKKSPTIQHNKSHVGAAPKHQHGKTPQAVGGTVYHPQPWQPQAQLPSKKQQ